MHVSFTTEENDFQKEVNSFFNEKYPADIKEKQNKSVPLEKEDFIRWQKTLYEQGWAAPNWPVEYGGTGWTPVQKYIFANENAKANAPAIVPFGLGMVGPVIYTYGNEAQKKKFLPGILASDVWWCQGYSEPGSGSDLASLKMKAERVGNEYVLNGTKTWTTLGHMADWIFCLVRTSSDVARRQEGISFILVDMATEGVSVKPIITIEGDREVNEVHFENVKVPAENLIGEEGKGWTYGKVLLQHERTSIAGVARSQYRLSRLKEKIRNWLSIGSCAVSHSTVFTARVHLGAASLLSADICRLRRTFTIVLSSMLVEVSRAMRIWSPPIYSPVRYWRFP